MQLHPIELALEALPRRPEGAIKAAPAEAAAANWPSNCSLRPFQRPVP
jgi:hypothetical protein